MPASLEIMTYNVNFVSHRTADTVAAIREADADIVFLQETTPRWERVLREGLGERYPYMEFVHHHWAGGLAVLSRRPYRTRAQLPSPVGKFPAWLLEFDTPLGAIQAMNLHLVPIRRARGGIIGRYLYSQKVRIKETRAYLDELRSDLPTLLVGDFNEDVRGRSLRLLQKQGYRSAMERFAKGVATWRWNTRVGEVKWQLDHILHTEHLLPIRARVIEAGNSDHFPVVATLTLAPERRQAANE